LSQNSDLSYLYTTKDRTLFNFTSSGQLSSVVDAHNLTVTYTYSSGNLSKITEPDGDVTSFAYSGGMLSTITKPGNLVTTLTQDFVQVKSPDGSNPAWSRDANGLPLTATDMLSQVTTMGNSTAGDLTSITRPDNSTVTYAYDSTYHKGDQGHRQLEPRHELRLQRQRRFDHHHQPLEPGYDDRLAQRSGAKRHRPLEAHAHLHL